MKIEKLFLNNLFYARVVIEYAIDQFKDISTIKILNDQYELEFIAKSDLPNIKMEFSNFCLAEMKHRDLVLKCTH